MTFALEDNKKVEIGAVLAPLSTFLLSSRANVI